MVEQGDVSSANNFAKDSKLLGRNNKIVSDFTEKANLFNDFFASQCTLISNSSILPSRNIFKTNKRLFALNIKKDDILKIIRKLIVNKAHGHDAISIRMLKICDSFI